MCANGKDVFCKIWGDLIIVEVMQTYINFLIAKNMQQVNKTICGKLNGVCCWQGLQGA